MDLEITIADQPLTLLPQRAVYLSRSSTLVVADLHWGKDATFRASAIPIPAEVAEADLARLSALVARTAPERLLVLGDLVHARHARDPATRESIGRWRNQHRQLSIVVVEGNHDRHGRPPLKEWEISSAGQELIEPPLVFRHHPQPHPQHETLAGHLHPIVHLHGAGREKLRVPCFWHNERTFILPAFSRFTGGGLVSARAAGSVYPIADGEVFAAMQR